MSFFNFKESNLINFAKLDYVSKSHNCNKAVIAAYYNVKKYGFVATDDYVRIDQSRRSVGFILNKDFDIGNLESTPALTGISEYPIFKKKEKEVCYDLHHLFCNKSMMSTTSRGLNFRKRTGVEIVDYKKDERLDYLYDGWKKTKEDDKKTFLMTFNPARYYRSYELLDHGFSIYQKLVLINKKPYAVINFALQNAYAYELSFLSLFKDPELRLINDQNDCIMVHCLFELFTKHGVGIVNLGTDAGIKGLKLFKHKLPHFETIVYRS